MKPKLTISLLVLVVSFWFSLPAVRAEGGGCLADPTPGAVTQYGELLQVIDLAPAFGQNRLPQERAQGVFYRQRLTVPYQAGQRVYLAGSAAGADICTDDLVRLTVDGQVWSYDFRLSGIIQPRALVDITYLFTSSDTHEVLIELVDVSPDRRSSSPYVLLIVEPEPSPPPAVIRTVSPPTSTSTPQPSPTLTPSPTPTRSPTPTATPSPTPLPRPSPEPPAGTYASPDWPLVPVAALALLTVPVLGLLASQLTKRPPGIPGQLEIYDLVEDQPFGTIDLARFQEVYVGSSADNLAYLADDPSIREREARIYARRAAQGSGVEAVLQTLTDEGQILFERVLFPGEEMIYGRYKLTYINPLAHEPTILDGSTMYEGG